MSKYKVTLLPNGDKSLPYKITVQALNIESAVLSAKEFVAKNGYWPSTMSMVEIMNCLTVHTIELGPTDDLLPQ